MKKLNIIFIFVLIMVSAGVYGYAMGTKPSSDVTTSASKVVINAKNGKNWIRGEYYFTYQFSKNPSIGTNILKVQVFDENGIKSGTLKVTGQVGMPSMSHAHDSGEIAFQTNKNNDYLLPVDLVMRGEWGIFLVFYKERHDYARARINIKI